MRVLTASETKWREDSVRHRECDPGIMCGPGSAAVSSGLEPSATAARLQNGKSGLRQDERPLEDGGAPRLAGLYAHMIPGSHSNESEDP